MAEVISVRFKEGGRVYYFDPAGHQIPRGGRVVVETARGAECGECVRENWDAPESQIVQPLKKVVRPANEADMKKAEENRRREKEAFSVCEKKILDHKLEMKLVDVEVFFDRSKLIFYFTAPARIDFRDLVKDLVREYRARIELRQIGVRHETQMVGAVGNCGMVCCCRRYLRKFAPVTIRMAKEQNLFLNPAKISGICGRLLCCLSYEQENYDHFHRHCPRLGKKYQTDRGGMKVLRANMFRNSLSVITENNEELELSLDEWQALAPHRPEPQQQGGQPKPTAKPRQGDGLLVVSVTPDTVEDPGLFDDLLPPDESRAHEDGQAAERPDTANFAENREEKGGAPAGPVGPSGAGEAGKGRRKRRRKPAQRPENE